MSKKYKKILFDLDNTLIDDNENRKYAIKKILIERHESILDEKVQRFIDIDDQFWKDRADGKIIEPYKFKSIQEKTEWLRAQRFIKYLNNISLDEAIQINQKYIKYLSEKIIPIKNVNETLKYLYEKEYEMYIVTNGPKFAVKFKLEKINVEKYFKDIFTAEEAGFMKPHNEFFKKFFEKVGIYKKEEMLIIGDELDKDVAGGLNNKIDSCWFNMKKIPNNTNLKPNYEINDLIQLKDIL